MTARESVPATGPDDGDADLVLSGGTVLTMDPRRPRVAAVAVRAERIVAAGEAAEVLELVGRRTERIDLGGRTLMPGLVDPHMHSALVQLADWIDISPMATPDADAVRDRLRTATPAATGWVLAQQFDPSITSGDPRLDREELDRLVPDHPALVLESNGHIAYANSAALRAAGVDRRSDDPLGGRYQRDAAGELTGRLEEPPAVAAFAGGFPVLGEDALVERIRGLLEHAAATGATMLHDCSIGAMAGAADLDALRRAMGEDSPVRYRGMLVSTAYDSWMQHGVRPGDGDDMLRVHGIKAWADGSNQAGTGYQREPYLGTQSCGALNHTPERLAEIIGRAHADGWQVGVHANGDAAIDATLDAYEQVLRFHPRPDHRHRIEHCSILHPEQIDRMAELGLSPSFLIGHLRWWGAAFRDRLLGPDRAARYDPCASALRGGLRISLHSDWSVTPLEPLRCVEDAVTRIMAENGEVLAGDERIPVEAALRAVTIDAAWQCRSDEITGSIEVGKHADLVLLEDDPTRVDPTRISGIPVSQTLVAGRTVFRR